MSFISEWIGGSLSYIGGFFYSTVQPEPISTSTSTFNNIKNSNNIENIKPIQNTLLNEPRISITPFSYSVLPNDCFMSNDIEKNTEYEEDENQKLEILDNIKNLFNKLKKNKEND